MVLYILIYVDIYRCNTIRKLIDDLWKNSSGSGGSSKSSINNIYSWDSGDTVP